VVSNYVWEVIMCEHGEIVLLSNFDKIQMPLIHILYTMLSCHHCYIYIIMLTISSKVYMAEWYQRS